MLPEALQAGIDELVGAGDPRVLERAARALSEAYRAGGAPASRAVRTPAHVAAYLATRAPATYTAAAAVFAQIRLARLGWTPGSVLDLGAGPGVATWAAVEAWPGITAVTLVEAEPEMVRAGRSLAEHGREVLQRATWTVADAGAARPQADLVVVSYVLGELEPSALRTFVDHAWSAAADTLVIVEAGTTAGYERVLAVRDVVLAAGGSTLAPCPTTRRAPCPRATGATSRPAWHGAERTALRRGPSGASRTRSSPMRCSAVGSTPGPGRACSAAPACGPGTSCSTSARRPGSSDGPSRRRRAMRTDRPGSWAGGTHCDGGAEPGRHA